MQADLAELIEAARVAERAKLRFLAVSVFDQPAFIATRKASDFRERELARLADDFQENHLQGSFY
jgi:hypothetical protein